jgi:hypothetical protein
MDTRKRKDQELLKKRRILKVLLTALEEIEYHFQNEGFGEPPPQHPESEAKAPEMAPKTEQQVDSTKTVEAIQAATPPEIESEEVEGHPDAEYYEDEGDFEDDYEEPSGLSFDREDIEVAIDAFLSQLVARKLIPKPKPGKSPSLSAVLADLLGTEDEALTPAENFEEFIEGYSGMVDHENMEQAHLQLVKLRELLTKRLAEIDDHAKKPT